MKKTLIAILFSSLLFTTAHAQTTIVPIVELKLGGLMGGVQNGKWIAPTAIAPKMKSEMEFVLVGWSGVEEGGVTLGKKGEQEDVCQDFTRFDFELEQENGVAIGSNAKWNPVPRIPKAIDPKNATYVTIVTNFLRKKGIARPIVRIKEAFRVDLEGDGVEESVLSATYYKNTSTPSAVPGDYSFVMVRTVKGKLVTEHLLDGEFYLKNMKFGAPNEHHVSAIADLNGDGKMEIVVNGFYYEGGFAGAFEMKNGKPVSIKEFDIACGV
jgi:hypothetical protein